MTSSTEDPGLGRFLTIADTAELLALSAAEVHQLIATGEIAAIRLGSPGQWRIERTVLEGFIESKYEESRRIGLWNQADFTGVLDFDTARKSSTD